MKKTVITSQKHLPAGWQLYAVVWFVLLLGGSGSVSGQSPDLGAPARLADVALASRIAKVLETQAKTLIERHLRPEQFQVLISVEARDQSSTDLPYVPSATESRPIQDLSPEELRPYIKKAEVEILIADRFKDTTRANIKSILEKKLALDPARGDQITFSSLGIEIDAPPTEIMDALNKAQAQTREIQEKISTIEKDRDDKQRELSAVKTALEVLKQGSNQKIAELIDASRKDMNEHIKERQKDRQKEEPKSSDSPKDKKPVEPTFLDKNVILLSAVSLIMVGLILVALTSRFALNSLARSFGAIGDAVKGFGEKVSEAVSNLTTSSTPAPQTALRTDETATSRGRAESQASATPKGSLEEMQARIMVLHQDLVQSLNAKTEGIILTYIDRLIENPATISQAVLAMELLGREKANEIFRLLDAESQAIVRDFMQTGSYERPKIEMMLEVGEQLKTKLLMEVFSDVRGQIDLSVASRILKLRAADLAVVASSLSTSALPRLFLYLDPKRLAKVLAALRAIDKTKFPLILKAVAQVPEVEKMTDLDEELVSALDQQISVSRDDSQRPYLNWYKAIAEAVDDDLAEEFCSQLASSSPQLEKYVRDQMITFSTFFVLLEDIQEELIVGLNNKTLASLVVGLSDQEKARIFVLIDQRRQELIAEEVDSLKAKGQRQVNVAHREAKNLIIASIKALKGSGTLEEFIDKNAKEIPKSKVESVNGKMGSAA
jgi:hypothetical protein